MENSLWNGFKIEEFIFAERKARLVYPDCEKNGKLLLKTEYWDAFPNLEIECLKRGYCLCNIEHYTRWGASEEIDIMADFVRHVAKKLGFKEKCIPVGMSCGGLQGTLLAEKYPELVSVLYLDAPVLNILSMANLGECPVTAASALFWRELVATYGFSRSTIVNFRKSPIDNMAPLIENNIPIIMLYGNMDNVVVYEENGKVLENYYKENGGIMKVIPRSMCEHHPHGLDDPTPIINFIEEHAR